MELGREAVGRKRSGVGNGGVGREAQRMIMTKKNRWQVDMVMMDWNFCSTGARKMALSSLEISSVAVRGIKADVAPL